MSDRDQMFTWSRSDDLPGLLADEATADEGRPIADLTGGLVNLRFFTAALRRSAWVWCLTGVFGLLIGSALYVKDPPAYHATATVLLGDSPAQDPAVEVLTDQSLAQSQAVAERVVQELKLPQSVASFLAACTATVVTDTVLTLNCGAPSSADAVQRTSALANAFIAYRAQYAQTQEQDQDTQLNQQYNAAKQSLATIDAQLNQLPVQGTTPAQKAEINSLQDQQGEQRQIEQYVTATMASAKTDTNDMVKGTFVLNAANAEARWQRSVRRCHRASAFAHKGRGALRSWRPVRRHRGGHDRHRCGGVAIHPVAPSRRRRGCDRRARAAQRRPVAQASLWVDRAPAGGQAAA